jgi:dethiobiotin synthetase
MGNMMIQGLFITGTGTDVGKTVVCACLARFLSRHGINVGIQKWVSTGNKNRSEDIDYCLSVLGKSTDEIEDPAIANPYTFGFPASPHLAAELEGKEISTERIKQSWQDLSARHDLLLVEGVGGVLVPLTRDHLLVDLVADLGIPVLIVTLSGLGTINHTLLTIEALTRRKMEILGMVFNLAGQEARVIEADNMKIISRLGDIRSFGALPKADSSKELFELFEPIGKEILQAISFRPRSQGTGTK